MTFATLALTSSELWVMATAACCASACAIPGCFLVLRRMSMLGDAIAHAILPGLALAFMVTASRSPVPMLAGALLAGLVAALGSSAVRRLTRLPEDTSLGLVFTLMFAAGVVLITFSARSVDLDPGCVLYGLLELVNFDRVTVLGVGMPRSFAWLAAVLLLNVALVGLLYKELQITSFDPALAATLGLAPALVGGVLLVMTTATCVASFEAVGSILVVAMLVAPGASASMLTDRLSRLLVLAVVIAAGTAAGGYLLAAHFNVTVAGMISALSGGVFVLCVLLSPRKGVLPRAARQARLSLRIAREDLLADAYRSEEAAGASAHSDGSHAAALGGAVGATVGGDASAGRARWLGRLALRVAVARGELTAHGTLTDEGRAKAESLVRAHRLWESYLSAHLPLAADHLHEPSHRAEHFIDPQTQREIARQLADDQVDPHGRPIPGASGSGRGSVGNGGDGL